MQNHTTTGRDVLTDILRGIAVLFMITAHGIFFFHNGANPAINMLERFLNMCTLTLFVFVSGIAASKQLHSRSHLPKRIKIVSAVKYSFCLYLAYTAVTIVAVLLTSYGSSLTDVTTKIFSALVFVKPVNFTEYIPLFIFLPVIAVLFPALIRSAGSSFIRMIVSGAVAFFIGMTVYPFEMPGIAGVIKSLLIGNPASLNFPVLFYLPVYLFGVWWDTNAKPKYVLIGSLLAAGCYLASRVYPEPFLSADIRWPPSAAFLLTGVSVAMLVYFSAYQAMRLRAFRVVSRIGMYIGKDALDFWISHLLLLFLYSRLIHIQYAGPLPVLFHLAVLFSVSVILSAVGVTNRVSYATMGPVSFAAEGTRRFRKRYIVYIVVSVALLGYVIVKTESSTLYGSHYPSESFGSIADQQIVHSIQLTSSRSWYGKHVESYRMIQLKAVTLDSAGIPVPADSVTFSVTESDIPVTNGLFNRVGNDIVLTIPVDGFPAGVHEFRVTGKTKNTVIHSNSVLISISEPLYIAWTFDWEGWEVSPDVFSQIEALRRYQKNFRVTHYVNPRMFLPSVMNPDIQQAIKSYLSRAAAAGDEIAMHIHMQYDLVESAGVKPRKNTHWGLRSAEGYDVPGSEYTPEEFAAIVTHAKSLLTENGFTNVTGYRAGGWYLTGAQLQKLWELGFLYDSSGRTKETTGAFRNTPWNLTAGEQPYFPDPSDQNAKSSGTFNGIMEIPNNALTTYESSPENLISVIRSVYQGGVLNEPKTLVYVSHPQFASREFGKIPQVLDALKNISLENDTGPVFFTTTGNMYTVWNTYLH